MLIKKIIRFFDKLEDKIRGKLSSYPILYAFIGGAALVLFWRGVWHVADDFNLSATASIIIGTVVLLLTGIFVSEFIGSKLIMTGLIGEKEIEEKEEQELETEETQLKDLQSTLNRLEKKLDHIDQDIEEK